MTMQKLVKQVFEHCSPTEQIELLHLAEILTQAIKARAAQRQVKVMWGDNQSLELIAALGIWLETAPAELRRVCADCGKPVPPLRVFCARCEQKPPKREATRGTPDPRQPLRDYGLETYHG